jgi:A/G-specific adenine glycosylase
VRAWDRLGYPRRALALHAAATVIAEQHDNVVPRDVDALLALPGIGDYTARAVAVFAYGDRHPVVDVNVRRVLARALLGEGQPGPANAKKDLPLMASVLPEDRDDAATTNAAVMELGALVCVSRSPACDACPIADRCAWRAAGYPEHDGPRAPRQAAFAGSDRQVRGLIMAELRASDVPVTPDEIAMVWPDVGQRDRALASLLRDGLAEGDDASGYRLPQS